MAQFISSLTLLVLGQQTLGQFHDSNQLELFTRQLNLKYSIKLTKVSLVKNCLNLILIKFYLTRHTDKEPKTEKNWYKILIKNMVSSLSEEKVLFKHAVVTVVYGISFQMS